VYHFYCGLRVQGLGVRVRVKCSGVRGSGSGFACISLSDAVLELGFRNGTCAAVRPEGLGVWGFRPQGRWFKGSTTTRLQYLPSKIQGDFTLWGVGCAPALSRA